MTKTKVSKVQRCAKVMAVSLLGVCTVSEANAAGFQLTDYSMTGLGRAYAGAGIVGDDYSALGYNPAGMSLMKKSGAQAGAAMIWQHGDVKGQASRGTAANIVTGKEHVDIPVGVPSVFAQYHINDTFDFGLGIYAPFGLASKYDHHSFISDHGITSSLEVIDIAPALSIRLDDQWTVGASLIARHGTVRMTNTSNGIGYSDFNIDGWGYYAKLGVMYEFTKDTRIGISYQTKNFDGDHQLKGDHNMMYMPGPMAFLNGAWDGGTETSLPEFLLLSGFHKQGKFGYSASARWTKWKNFNDFKLTSTSPLGFTETDYNWDNTWTVSVGVDYYYSEKWTFRAGLGFDESPVKNAGKRTPRIPDNDRYWMSVGASYALNDKVRLDFGYSHLYLPTYKARNGTHTKGIGGTSTMPIDVKYDVNAEILGLQVQYDF